MVGELAHGLEGEMNRASVIAVHRGPGPVVRDRGPPNVIPLLPPLNRTVHSQEFFFFFFFKSKIKTKLAGIKECEGVFQNWINLKCCLLHQNEWHEPFFSFTKN